MTMGGSLVYDDPVTLNDQSLHPIRSTLRGSGTEVIRYYSALFVTLSK